MTARLPYIIGFVLLVAAEVCIGVFYFSKFRRAYLGDVIIVWVLYCLFRSFVPRKFNSCAVAVGILVFSFAVEFLQKAHIADILGVKNELLRIETDTTEKLGFERFGGELERLGLELGIRAYDGQTTVTVRRADV